MNRVPNVGDVIRIGVSYDERLVIGQEHFINAGKFATVFTTVNFQDDAVMKDCNHRAFQVTNSNIVIGPEPVPLRDITLQRSVKFTAKNGEYQFRRNIK